MSDFQCKFYLLDGAETFSCKEGDAEYVIKIADRPFPDSLLSFVYYDINSWEPRFHEAERSLIKFYQTRDTTCLKPVQKLLDDFKGEHPYFFYLWLDWSDQLKQAEAPDCKNPTKTFAAQGTGARSEQSRDHAAANSAPVPDGAGRKHHRCWTFPFGCRHTSRHRLCRNLISSR